MSCFFRTPLMGAANRGRKEVCEFLLRKGAERNLTDIRGMNIRHGISQNYHYLRSSYYFRTTINKFFLQRSRN